MRILIFRTGQLGDTLIALPAIHAIRSNFPNASIAFLYDRHVGQKYVLGRELLERVGCIDEFVEYEIAPRSGKWAGLRRLVGTWRLIQKLKIDRVYQLSVAERFLWQTVRDWIFFRSAGVSRIFNADGFRRRQRQLPAPADGMTLHEADFYLLWLKGQNLKVPVLGRGDMDLRLSVAEISCAELVLKRLDSSRPVIAICAGAKDPVKVWPIDRYCALAKRLRSELDCSLVILGDKNDFEIAETILGAAGGGINLCGETTPRESAAVLRKTRLYVGNDTGCMHLAATVGTPCVAIFSSRDVPGKWYPYGDGHRVFRREIVCQGCMLKICEKEDMRCIKSIAVEEVYLACADILQNQASSLSGKGL